MLPASSAAGGFTEASPAATDRPLQPERLGAWIPLTPGLAQAGRLSGADLSRTHLVDADLRDIDHDHTTMWPTFAAASLTDRVERALGPASGASG